MKRRHYRIHYNDKSHPMHRVKHREIPWGTICLAAAALILVCAGAFAVVKWFELGGSGVTLRELLEGIFASR